MTHPIRRVTIVVSDLEKSLFLYRDLLGMQVFYDQIIKSEATSMLLGVPHAEVRIVSLQEENTTVGMIGLLDFLTPSIKPRKEIKSRLHHSDIFLLMMSENIDIKRTFYHLKDSGIKILCPPLEYEVPQRGLISGFTCLDPDGVSLAIMRFGSLKKSEGKIKGSPLRRVSLVVDDLDRSLFFYRDILGLKIFYDQEILSEEEGKMLGIPGARVRIVSLQGDHSTIGMVGLLSIISPPIQPRKIIRQFIQAPDIILIFNTEDIETIFKKVQDAGVPIQSPPIEYEIPGRGLCAGFSCYDPNGILVEFTQFGPIKERKG